MSESDGWLEPGAIAGAAAGVGFLIIGTGSVIIYKVIKHKHRNKALLFDEEQEQEEQQTIAIVEEQEKEPLKEKNTITTTAKQKKKKNKKEGEDEFKEPDFSVFVREDLPLPSTIVAQTKRETLDHAKQLGSLLVQPPLTLARAILDTAQTSESDIIAKSLIFSFSGFGKCEDVASLACVSEVERAKSCNLLLRADTCASKVFGHFAKLSSLPNIFNRLRPICYQVQKKSKSNKVFDVDPFSTANLSNSTIELIDIHAQLCFDAIISKPYEYPKSLRSILRCVRNSVHAKFPGYEKIAVGGLLFLRFINPLLTVPQNCGLFNESLPVERPQRMMIAITKLLQHLANGTKPGGRQPRLSKLDSFIERNIPKLDLFYEQLLSDDQNPAPNPQNESTSSNPNPNPNLSNNVYSELEIPVPESTVENAQLCLQQKLQRNWPMIIKAIATIEGPESQTLRAISSWSPI